MTIRSGFNVELDHALPNGRDRDILLEHSGRSFQLENTEITQDNEAHNVSNRYLPDKRYDSDKVLISARSVRPFDAKGPSPTEVAGYFAKTSSCEPPMTRTRALKSRMSRKTDRIIFSKLRSFGCYRAQFSHILSWTRGVLSNPRHCGCRVFFQARVAFLLAMGISRLESNWLSLVSL